MNLHQNTIARLAHLYRDAPHTPPCAAQRARMEDEARRLFSMIPLPVVFHSGSEPFCTMPAMRGYAERCGTLKMKDYQFVSAVWGDAYNELRAVHDWFGHIGGEGEFSIPGEVQAWCQTLDLFHPETNRYVFCEVVLANAHKDVFGPIGWDKVVCLTMDEIASVLGLNGDPQDWWFRLCGVRYSHA